MEFLGWLEGTSYAGWVAASLWGWAIMLSLHAIGIAAIVGIVFVVSFRLLGLYKTIPCASLSKYLEIAWYGVVLNVITGLSIFTTQATYYITSLPFLLKITFIVFGCVNIAYMQKVLKRDSGKWDTAKATPALGLVLAGSSMLFWTMAVITGRLIAYM